MGDGNDQEPDEQPFRRTSVQTVDDPIQEMIIVKKMFFVQVSCELKRIGYPGFPVALANSTDHPIQELLNRTGPASAPCHSAGLPLSLMGTQLVDAHALGQPQSSRERDVLVETLFKEDLSSEAMWDGTAQASKASRRIR